MEVVKPKTPPAPKPVKASPAPAKKPTPAPPARKVSPAPVKKSTEVKAVAKPVVASKPEPVKHNPFGFGFDDEGSAVS